MDAKQQELLKRQEIIAEGIRKIGVNFGKDGPDRKNAAYIKVRMDNLKAHWNEFEMNHGVLLTADDQTNKYYSTKAYEVVRAECVNIQQKLQAWPTYTAGDKDSGNHGENSKNTGVSSKSDELKTQQATNFRAFSRFTRNLGTADITEKWDIEDKLKTLESRWKVIDQVHWELDNILVGSDVNYELEFSRYEETYESTKRDLNRKLNLAVQQRDSAPKIEIPIFSGNYSQWSTFLDLYTAAIHKNPTFSKGQKMQHLKGKLKGEAERLVQHLPVSENNYDSCWEILNHRYNNLQLLFTKQMQTLMSQTTIQQQNAYELKRLHDTSLETVHALRNLGIDTSTWDPILVHVLAGRLDSQTYSDYMEARKHPRELPVFSEFILFVENKFTALESITKKKGPINYNKQPNSSQNKETTTTFQKDTYNKYKRYPKANHTSCERNCPICKTNHILLHCQAFQEMTPDVKLRTLEQLDICKNCMYSHNGKKCISQKRCRVCNNSHHTTLHDMTRDTEPMTLATGQRPNYVANNKSSNTQGKANHVSGNFNEVLLSTVMLKVKAADGTYITLRCLLDQGSQLNLISESAVQRLGLRRYKQNSTVSGIGTSASLSNGTVQLNCESLYGDYQLTTQALVMAKLLNNLPNYSFEKQDWPHIKNINLADPQFNLSRPVDILLDAGVYADIIMSNILRGNINAPIAQQTKLGWVLVGNTKTFNCHVVVNTDDISRFWEMEEITSSHNESSTVEEEYCESLYTQTTKRLEDGRYEVRIPMKQDFEQHLGRSKPQAVAQFKQLEKRLNRDEVLASSYKAFINEYIALNHMKPCTMPTTSSCFLPHHGVLRPDSTTTKLRVVFNASATTSTGHSLNQLMECGPNLQQDLQAMILRWRAFEYVYTADIEKFYRQIRIQESDQHLQKIVWRNSDTKPLQEYQLTTVTYGTKSAPFLAMRTIKQLIDDDGAKFPLAAKILSNQLYVDDLLGGCYDIFTAQKAQNELVTMLKGGGFNLRKWASNNTFLLENLPNEQISQGMFDFKDAETNKTLGLTWNPHTDQFTYKQIPLSNKRDVNTKRTLLSDISKLYDPLGWLSPITLKAKLIFQQAWTTSTGWDDILPSNIRQEWEQFRQQMVYIHDITIPRWIGNTRQSFELHGFCDASERAYGCVIYCKSTDKAGKQLIRLVAAKTKLAPLKKPISLPRLELCGAALLAQLVNKVKESINERHVTTYSWTDSMVVLGWLQGDEKRWKSFVANRVAQIKQIIPPNFWRHVKSQENPADCASRGLLPSDFISHTLWWNAPSWLQNNNIANQEVFTTTEEQKKRQQICATQATHTPLIENLLQQYSSMTKATRVVSWILRFINNSRDATNSKRMSYLTTEDLELAQNLIIKTVQNNSFGDDIACLHKQKKARTTSKLLSLSPRLDAQGFLRVGERLGHANLNNSQKHPLILPNNHKLSELLIEQAHKVTLHGGARLTLGYLRNKYWILGGMKTIKKQLIKCIICHRYKTQRSTQLMADLPTPRVTPSQSFTHTGVDFTGHVEIKANKGRGITKLSRLPIETGSQTEDQPTQGSQDKQEEMAPDAPPLRRKQRPGSAKKGVVAACWSTLLLFIVTCVTPSVQQLVNVTALDPSRLVFFDKTADLQIIQDEWRLVVYYNMSTYWRSVSAVEQYINQLRNLDQQNMACFSISTQFEHELNELKHYHAVLQYEHGKRSKRGFVNGIGNIANSLFGVLDDKFAEKYHKDIKMIQSNENHLLDLYKNQTSVIEGEYNLLKRNEQVMNRQFIVINKQLRDSIQQLKTNQEKATFITATALAANMMIANLRRIQDTLIDLVTDIRNGKVDTHLLKPDAFEKQLNIISGQVPKGLSLPCTNSLKCIQKMYKLSSVHGKLVEDFLIFEVKIPLVTDELYELTEIIPIRNVKGSSMTNIIPTAKYMAVNLRKDMIIPLNQQQILSCLQANEHQLLCNFDLPIYEIKTSTNICEADIINNRETSSCRTEISSCMNEWIRLHSKDAWLFTCCEECTMRIFCPAAITSQTLRNTGTITLAAGCMMRGDNHIIHSHYNLQSKMELGKDDEVYIPETNINYLVTSYNRKVANLTDIKIETHEEQLNSLKRKIEHIKEQQDIQTIKSADAEQHHYVLYGFITVCGIILCIWVLYKVKRRRLCTPQMKTVTTPEHQGQIEMEVTQMGRKPKADEQAIEEITEHPLRAYPSDSKVDCGTSPMPLSTERRIF